MEPRPPPPPPPPARPGGGRGALMPEGTLSFGKSVLGELGVGPDSIEPIMNSLRAADYASIRGVGGTIREDVPKDAAAAVGKRD